MTTIDIDAMLATADMSDRTDRLMLADALDDAGRPDEAAAHRLLASRPAPAPCDWRDHVRDIIDPANGGPAAALSAVVVQAVCEASKGHWSDICRHGPGGAVYYRGGCEDVRTYLVEYLGRKLAHLADSTSRIPSAASLLAHRDLCVLLGHSADAAAEFEGYAFTAAVREAAESRRSEAAARRKERMYEAQCRLADDLEARAKVAYARKDRSEGYRLRERAALLRAVFGFVDVLVVDTVRGTPPAGVVWVRPSSGGKWSKSKVVKRGRPLTVEEMEARLAE